MIISPLPNVVYLKLDTTKAGVLDVSSRESKVECAEIMAVPEGEFEKYNNLKVGDKVFVKAWAIDFIDYEGERYCFVNLETNGILAKINEID